MKKDVGNYRSAGGALKDSWIDSVPYYRYALCVLTLTALLNMLWVAYHVGYSEGTDAVSRHSISVGDSIRALNIRIGLALLVSMISLWLRGVIGFFVSTVALAYVGLEYAAWYADSVRALKILGMESWADFQDPDFPFVGVLRGANWWNVVVLAVVSLLLAWQLTLLVKLRGFLSKDD